MIRTKLFLACALAFVVSLAGTPATAQQPVNQLTYFTFSAPFELPGGEVLPAGKYVFKILDSPSNRHVVQIMSEDQTEMHATLLAIPAQRIEPAEEPEVRFMEAEANAAPAIRTWWYPGRVVGHEFIYPKDHARRLAARQSEGVLTVATDATTADEMETADLARIGADGREAAVNAETQTTQTAENRTATETTAQSTTAQTTQPMTPETTTPQTTTAESTPQTTAAEPQTTTTQATPGQTGQTQTAQTRTRTAEDTTRTTDTTAMDTTRTELPQTASPLPLVALLGLGSLIGAGALRLRR